MKKKNYEKPQVEIIEVKQTEIICTSGTQFQSYEEDNTFNGGWNDL